MFPKYHGRYDLQGVGRPALENRAISSCRSLSLSSQAGFKTVPESPAFLNSLSSLNPWVHVLPARSSLQRKVLNSKEQEDAETEPLSAPKAEERVYKSQPEWRLALQLTIFSGQMFLLAESTAETA